jgi:hypothetical protein
MPIEIRELVIKTTIVENNSVDNKNNSNVLTKHELAKIKEEILQACQEKLNLALRKTKER